MTTMYAVMHATCQHAAFITSDRTRAERLADTLHEAGHRRWRVHVLTRDPDQRAAVTTLIQSDPQAGGCATCNLPPDVAGTSPVSEARR